MILIACKLRYITVTTLDAVGQLLMLPSTFQILYYAKQSLQVLAIGKNTK